MNYHQFYFKKDNEIVSTFQIANSYFFNPYEFPSNIGGFDVEYYGVVEID